MVKNLKQFSNLVRNKEIHHVFILSSPIVVFISKLIIEEFNICQDNIITISRRETNCEPIGFNLIKQKNSFFDRLFKKLFLFSFQGFQIRREIERITDKFILYCDWDNREVIEILNSSKCFGHAYIEEGQLSFNNFKSYVFKKDRLSQWKRLRRWSNSVNKMARTSDIPVFNECFNKNAFAFFTIYSKAFPSIPFYQKFLFNDFQSVKKFYKPKLIGRKNIGIMCSPRRFRLNRWKESINCFIDLLPEKSVIKLHPEFYANEDYLKKFNYYFTNLNFKNLEICDKSVIIEAEMLFEKKILYGPMTSLKTYAPLLGSDFINISIY